MLTEIQMLHWDLVYHQYFLILQSPSPGKKWVPNLEPTFSLVGVLLCLTPICPTEHGTINQECPKDIFVDDATLHTGKNNLGLF